MGRTDDSERTLEADTLTRSELMKRAAALGVTLTGVGALAGVAGAAPLARAAGEHPERLEGAAHPGRRQVLRRRVRHLQEGAQRHQRGLPGHPLGELGPDVHERLRGREPADLHYDVGIYFGKFAQAGKIVALDQKYASTLKPLLKNYDATQLQSATLNKHLYGLPFIGAGISFVWNKKLFKAAGLDPNTPPKTWRQVMAYAKKLTNTSAGTYGYAIMDDTTGEMVNFYPSIMVNYGGKLVDSTGKWVFDDAKAQAGLNVLVSMYQDGYMPKFGTFVGHDLDTAFLEGKVAMMLSYSSFLIPLLPKYPGFQMGVSVTPRGPANGFSLGGAGFWSIATASDDQDAAWEPAPSTSARRGSWRRTVGSRRSSRLAPTSIRSRRARSSTSSPRRRGTTTPTRT